MNLIDNRISREDYIKGLIGGVLGLAVLPSLASAKAELRHTNGTILDVDDLIDGYSSIGGNYLKLDQTNPQTITATDTTITASDEIYFGDATDGFKIKKDTIQGILDLTPAPDLSGLVPYTGATGNVNLGAYGLTATDLTLTGKQTLALTSNTSTNGIIYKGENRWLSDFRHATGGTQRPVGNNLFLGLNAGNLTMGSAATQTFHASNNIITGLTAGAGITTGYNNVIMGNIAANAGTTTYKSVIIGHNAMPVVTSSGYENVVIGESALAAATTPIRSVYIGFEAARMRAVTTTACVYIGYQAGYRQESGNGNIGIGYRTLGYINNNFSGAYNTALGMEALTSNTSGTQNVGIGYESLFANTTGRDNIALGYRSGRYIGTATTAHTNGQYSIFIGNDARPLADGETNQIVIGYQARGKGSNTAVIGNSNSTGLYLPADNYAIFFGAESDASIYYDGTDLKINPKNIGSGIVDVLGNLKATEVLAKHKANDGTAAVADGTYTMGLGATSNGTITIKDGIITAVQQCVP